MIAPAGMDNNQLGILIRGVAKTMLEDQSGFWKFEVDSAVVFVVTDESHNRMRIMTPVSKVESISAEQCQI